MASLLCKRYGIKKGSDENKGIQLLNMQKIRAFFFCKRNPFLKYDFSPRCLLYFKFSDFSNSQYITYRMGLFGALGNTIKKPNFLFLDQAAVQDPDWVRGPYAEQRAVRTLRGPSVPHRADRDQAAQVCTSAFSNWRL
jgi:hypothetical protein